MIRELISSESTGACTWIQKALIPLKASCFLCNLIYSIPLLLGFHIDDIPEHWTIPIFPKESSDTRVLSGMHTCGSMLFAGDKHRGFAIIGFAAASDAVKAVQKLHGSKMMGRALEVTEFTKKKQQPSKTAAGGKKELPPFKQTPTTSPIKQSTSKYGNLSSSTS